MTTAAAENTNGNALSLEGMSQVTIETQAFELAQRKAGIYAKSSLVPKEYQNNIGNVLIAENMARRMGADTLMVMQNLYIVHGKPGWSAQFLIGCFNSNGRFSAIKYRFSGKEGTDDWGCQAYCTEVATGEEISGTRITWPMAVAEGWVNKPGSKWKTMPEQMFRYRAATFLIRSTAPEIGLGLLTKEELEDMGPQNHGGSGGMADKTREGIDALKERIGIGQGDPVVEAEPVTEPVSETASEIPTPSEPDYVDSDALEEPDEVDEVEKLRANVQAAWESLPKGIQKDVLAGKTPIASASVDELNQFLVDFRKASE